MQRIVCVFAHPDDEAFGPGGTIALLAQQCEVSVVCVTCGNDSRLSDHEAAKLGQMRREEMRRSTAKLGVKELVFFDYQDGKLCNLLYHDIAYDLEKFLTERQADTLMTFEPRGVSGHIDHITVSMVTSFVFEKLPFVKKLMYYCISEANRALHGDYFIYFPPGYSQAEIDEAFDVSSVWETKVAAMMEHTSQLSDAERILKRSEKLPKEEYFLVKKKHG